LINFLYLALTLKLLPACEPTGTAPGEGQRLAFLLAGAGRR
jgi:hypothetical protein